MKNIQTSEIIRKINENFLFVLSYGHTKRLIPIGVFKLDKIVKSRDSLYNYGSLSDDDIMVKLVKYDYNNLVIDKKEIIYMSFDKFIKLLGTTFIRDNKAVIENLLKKEVGEIGLLDAMKVISMILSTNEYYDLRLRQSKTLNQLDATYEVSNETMGTNYSIIPFYYDKQINLNSYNADNKIKYIDKDTEIKNKTKSNA